MRVRIPIGQSEEWIRQQAGELIHSIYQAELEIEEIKTEYQLEAKKKMLKELLLKLSPDGNGFHLVIVDGLRAKVFQRAGRRSVNYDKLEMVVTPEVFDQIVTVSDPTFVLDTIMMSNTR